MPPADRSGVQFIVSTDVKETSPETRKLIRSHVMQGKNKVKTKPHRAARPKPADRSMMVDPSQSPEQVPVELLVDACHSFIPCKVGSETSFTNLADEIPLSKFGDIMHFFTIVMKYIFPLGEFIAFDRKDKKGFELLALDASYLHVTAFAAGSFIDMVLRQQEHMDDPETILHFLKGIRLLRTKLLQSDEKQRLSDATVSVVLTLATCAYGMGDYEAAKRHMEGLHIIVKLRGGLATLRGPFLRKLLMEMLRCDIGISLHTGSPPMIFRDPVLEPLIQYPDQKAWVIGKSSETANSKALLSIIDADLAAAWVAMQRFCSLVNLAIETHRMFSMDIVLNTMASVMYRLLGMSFEIGSLDEGIRLGQLALCYSIFLQWQGMSLSSSQFPSAFRNSVLDLKIPDEVPRQIVLWLLMLGSISIFTCEDDTWLKDILLEDIEMCQITSWNELRGVLKSFMWISSLHDRTGKRIFESLTSL